MSLQQIKDYFKEVNSLFVLALPLMFMQAFSFLKGMVDTMMVGHVDEIQLAGMSLANSVHVLFMLFQASFSIALVPIISSYYAKKEYDNIKYITQQAFYINIVLTIVFGIFFTNADFLFAHLDLLDETKIVAADSLRWLGYSNFFVCFGFVLKALMQGMAKNKWLLVFTGFNFFLNIPLNMMFIYGWGGIVEPMGGVGSAIATSLCFVIEFITVFIYAIGHEKVNPMKHIAKYDWSKLKGLISSGFAIGVSIIMEVGLFAAIAFLAARFGEIAVSANQVAMNFTGIVFTFSLGLSMAVMQKSAYLVGLKDSKGLKTIVFSSAGVATLLSIVSVTLTLIFKEDIIALYTSDSEIATIAVNILIISIFYQFFDSLQITALGLLRSYELYNSILKRAFVSYWIIGVGTGYYFSIEYGVYGFWFGFVLCFISASILYYKKVHSVVWKKVINDE